jgi:hypothetical protein
VAHGIAVDADAVGHIACLEDQRLLRQAVLDRRQLAGGDEILRDPVGLVIFGQRLLAPSLATLAEVGFLFGKQATWADAALYGCCAMLKAADPELLTRISSQLPGYMERVEAQATARGRA